MEDIIYFNTYRDGKNLNVYMGVYNIFMLCNKNRVTFIHGNVHYPAEGGRPKQVSDAQGYVYLTNNPIIRGTVKSLAREKTIIENDFINILRHSYTFQEYLGEQIAGTLLRVLLYDIWTYFHQLTMKCQDEGLPSLHFARFLLEARYNCSKHLSAENLSLTDLAKEMNFSSLPAFTRYVKRVLGCSPSEFRDSLKKKYVFIKNLSSE